MLTVHQSALSLRASGKSHMRTANPGSDADFDDVCASGDEVRLTFFQAGAGWSEEVLSAGALRAAGGRHGTKDQSVPIDFLNLSPCYRRSSRSDWAYILERQYSECLYMMRGLQCPFHELSSFIQQQC